MAHRRTRCSPEVFKLTRWGRAARGAIDASRSAGRRGELATSFEGDWDPTDSFHAVRRHRHPTRCDGRASETAHRRHYTQILNMGFRLELVGLTFKPCPHRRCVGKLRTFALSSV
jgi:hypothetical protein